MATAGRKSGTFIQALRHIGHYHVDDHVLEILRRQLNDQETSQLLLDIKYAPVWIGHIIRQLAGVTA